MAYMLPHLRSGWSVDQAILNEEDRVVVIRFGHDADDVCMLQDECLYAVADTIKAFAVIYLVRRRRPVHSQVDTALAHTVVPALCSAFCGGVVIVGAAMERACAPRVCRAGAFRCVLCGTFSHCRAIGGHI